MRWDLLVNATPVGMAPKAGRSLVPRDLMHRDLAVMDVVYNHFGPDGAYLGAFSPYYFSARHQTPWGDAVNLDGEQKAAMVSNLLVVLCSETTAQPVLNAGTIHQ